MIIMITIIMIIMTTIFVWRYNHIWVYNDFAEVNCDFNIELSSL